MRLLNIGCGSNIHEDWTNLDLKESEFVTCHNITDPLPFDDNGVDVIYHSHVLEHLTKEEGKVFILDCYRALRKNGIMRVVIPDMEQIIKEYLANLEKGFSRNDYIAVKRYQWNKIELFDQMIRRNSGGEMLEMCLNGRVDKEYAIERNGDELLPLLELDQENRECMLENLKKPNTINNPQTSGEAHKWMYDKLDLKLILEESGFQEFKIVKYNESRILNWSEHKLDTSKYGDYPRKPDSLFTEVVKPNSTNRN